VIALCLQGGNRRVLLLGLFFCTVALGFAQSRGADYNAYYQFPFSLGFEYQNLSPFSEYASRYSVFDVGLNVRWPIRRFPALQPAARVGLLRFDSQDPVQPYEWDHTHWYGALGLGYSHRFAKPFEVGVEALAGYSVAYFPDLLPEEGLTPWTPNLFLEVGGRLALDPSFNYSIDIHPNLKYLLSLGPLKEFNSLIFGIGFSVAYRFGQDPDAPQAEIRSLRFDQLRLSAAFAAMQSYYAKNPIGSMTLTNTDRHSVTELQVSFFQAGYMDSPTPTGSIQELKPGQSIEIPLIASFNQEVFRTEGITPLTGEVLVSYKSRGRAAEQRQSVSYDLHDKTAITWDDDRKAAAFITPSDSALRNYASFIRQACKEQLIPAWSESLQLAVQVFHALCEIGCLYQADPALPFTWVQGHPEVVDSISLPRDTLKRITGDCDDLTVLYCSLLEAAGTETAFITVPGHIYAAFNTGVPVQEFRRIHRERGMTIPLVGKLWVPVEVTLIGKTGFLEAWRRGAEVWRRHEDTPEKRGFYPTRICQQIYRPVGLKETDLGLQYGRKEAIREGFQRDMEQLSEDAIRDLAEVARQGDRAEDYNRLGIGYAGFGQLDLAEQAFSRALSLQPAAVNTRVNLANVTFLRKDYTEALRRYQEIYRELESSGNGRGATALKVLLNQARVLILMKRTEEAQACLDNAKVIDPSIVGQYEISPEPGTGNTRAQEEREPWQEILFATEEEE
jgi:tetratricopeptide (TPR) repeat protein